MFLADLHIHSTFSDGTMTIPEIVDFYGRRRFGCIAVTDHLCEQETVLGRAATFSDSESISSSQLTAISLIFAA